MDKTFKNKAGNMKATYNAFRNLYKYFAQPGLFSSGIVYLGLLSEIRDKININRSLQLSVAGVGSGNPVLKDMVHVQTAEMNALISSCHDLFNNRENLLVIDIGTQDVKVLHFANMDSPPWINMNKSCGAGT